MTTEGVYTTLSRRDPQCADITAYNHGFMVWIQTCGKWEGTKTKVHDSFCHELFNTYDIVTVRPVTVPALSCHGGFTCHKVIHLPVTGN